MNITRQQAIAETSLELVQKVEAQNVDSTNRVTDGTKHNGYTEFSASVGFSDKDGLQFTLTMLVFVDTDDITGADELDQIDWDARIAQAEYRID